MEFEVLVDLVPIQGRLVLDVLQTHRSGELLVPQCAGGTRLQALAPFLRPVEASPAITPGSAAGGRRIAARWP